MSEYPLRVDEEAYELVDLAARVRGETKKKLVSEAVKDYMTQNEELMEGIRTLRKISEENIEEAEEDEQ